MSAAPEQDIDLWVPENDASPELGLGLPCETWQQFEAASTDTIPMLVDNLWPESSVGFIAAPPKKGKTWLGLTLAISIATGTPFLGKFTIPGPRPVLLLALEGHRAALRGRIGCLARGQGIDPDSDQLDNLHISYKPEGLDLIDPVWISRVRAQVNTLGAAILIVDVLRAAASLKENDNTAFGIFINKLRPITNDGCSLGLNHHFGKLTEITKERTPGERMAGAGAMYGAFDVGVFITGSEEGARKLRVEFEVRDLADPSMLGVRLTGNPTGVNGGFTYHDTAYWKTEEAPDEADLTANAADVHAWLEQQATRSATTAEIAYAFEVSEKTVDRRRLSYAAAGVEYVPKKGAQTAYYRLPPDPILPDTTLPDNVQQLTVSTTETPEMQEKDDESIWTRTLLDNDACPDVEEPHLQGLSLLDTLDTPTECIYTVSGDAPEPERLAYLDAIRPEEE